MSVEPAVRAELARLLKQEGYEHREEPFRLTSGGWSQDYVDGKHAVARGPMLRLACEAVLEAVGEEFDAIGGPTMGADALAHGVSILSGAAWFSVRKEPKGHGRGAWVEGYRLDSGDRVVMVEDVSSTGASLLRATERVLKFDVTIVAATALLDRSPQVADLFAGAGIRWAPLLTWEDLGIPAI